MSLQYILLQYSLIGQLLLAVITPGRDGPLGKYVCALTLLHRENVCGNTRQTNIIGTSLKYKNIYLKTHESLLLYIHTQCFMQNESTLFSGYTITESHIKTKQKQISRTYKGTGSLGFETS